MPIRPFQRTWAPADGLNCRNPANFELLVDPGYKFTKTYCLHWEGEGDYLPGHVRDRFVAKGCS